MGVVKQQITSEVVDNETGEIIKRTEDIIKTFSNEPPYVKFYLHDILYLSDLPKTHDKILLSLLKKASWANAEYGMVFTLSAGLKRMMAKELNFKNARTINNALSDFVKADIFKRLEVGVYQLNPYLFGRGNWQNVEKLRMEIEYTLAGRTFKSMIEYKDKINEKQDKKTGDTQEEKIGDTDSPETDDYQSSIIAENKKKKTQSDAPESSQTHKKPLKQEKILESVEKPKKETKMAKLEGTERQVAWAEQIRERFHRQFEEENSQYEPQTREGLAELFETKKRAKYWIESREKRLEELE